MMISPKKLRNSKWTKQQVTNKERHFFVVKVSYDDNGKVTACIIQAVINNNQYAIDWRQLKDATIWRSGWR